MSHRKIDLLQKQIASRYRFVRMKLEPIVDPEDREIRWFLWLLDVPRVRVQTATNYAVRQALKLYAPGPLRVYTRAVTPEYAAKHFPTESSDSDAHARNGAKRVRSRRSTRSSD